MTSEGKVRGQPIVIERSYKARIEDVWNLWATKEGFESWWGPQGFRADVQELDARVGGPLQYDMVADTPEMIAAMASMGRPASHPTRSRFTELRLHERLVLTNVIDFLPGVPPYTSNITVEFSVRGDTVTMVVTLDPMHSDDFSNMQKQGFTSQLTKLDARFG
ncbi:MAG: hypothetical protein RL385_3564 [Pseudomonadota bacterium]|jgi:uncharacterized protein YndB with AHSA1/START domain